MFLNYEPNYKNNGASNWKEDLSTPITPQALNNIENNGIGYITNNINYLIDNIGNSTMNTIQNNYVSWDVDYKGLTTDIIADRIKKAIKYTRTTNSSYSTGFDDKIRLDFSQVNEGEETLPNLMKKFSYSRKGTFNALSCDAFSKENNPNKYKGCLCEINAKLVFTLDDRDGSIKDDYRRGNLLALDENDRNSPSGEGSVGSRNCYITWQNGKQDSFSSSRHYSTTAFFSPVYKEPDYTDSMTQNGKKWNVRIPICLGYYFPGATPSMQRKDLSLSHTAFTIDYEKSSSIVYTANDILIEWDSAPVSLSLEARVDKENISVEDITISHAYFIQPGKHFYTLEEFFRVPSSESDGE